MSLSILRTSLIWTLLLGCIGLGYSSESIDTVYFNNGEFGDQVILKSHLTEILEDKNGEFSAEDILANPHNYSFDHSQDEFPYNKNLNSVYWIRFYGKNLDNHGQPYILDIHSPNVEKLTLYTLEGPQVQDRGSVGLQVPFHDRSYRDKNLLLNLPLPNGSNTNTYLIRVEKGGFCRFDFFLTPNNYFMYFSKGEYYFIGIFYGFIFCMIVYNLLMFFALKERVYLFYILVLLAGSLVTLSEDRMGYLWLWNGYPHLSYYLGIHVAPNLILLFFSIYAISYLQIKDKKDLLIITTAGFVHLAFYGTNSLIYGDIPSTDSLYFLPFVAMLWIAIKERLKNGQKVSANFIAGASFFLLTIIIEELRHQKLLFGGFWVVFNFHITLVVQSIILSLSIFDRLKSIRAEKENLNQNIKKKEIESVSQQFQTLGHEHIAKELRSLLTLLKSPLEGVMNGQGTENNTKNLQDVYKATQHIERFVESVLNDDSSTHTNDLYTGDVMRTASDTITGLKYIAIEKGIALNVSRDPQSLICNYNNHQYQSIIFNATLLAIKSASNSTTIDTSLNEGHNELKINILYTMGAEPVSDSEFLTDILRKACESIGASFNRTCKNRSCVVKLVLPFIALSIEEPSPSEIQDARIMMIDSNDRLMNYVGDELKELPIVKMVSAKRGLELLKKYPFDLIITEIKDLDLSGTELISEIRNIARSTSIIVLSGNKSSKDKNEIIGLGVEGYMSKPFNIEELKERTSYLLKKQEQEMKSAQKNSIVDSSVERVLLPMKDDFMEQVIESIEGQLGDPNFNVDQLAHKVGMSRAQLYRKFKSEVGESVKEFIRNYRLKVAGKLLKETSLSVKEVMIHVGFLNRQHFSKSFKEAHNLSPSAYKQRYSVALN